MTYRSTKICEFVILISEECVKYYVLTGLKLSVKAMNALTVDN